MFLFLIQNSMHGDRGQATKQGEQPSYHEGEKDLLSILVLTLGI